MRDVTAVEEVAGGPIHARHGFHFVRSAVLPGCWGAEWTVDHEKRTAGGNIAITVLEPE